MFNELSFRFLQDVLLSAEENMAIDKALINNYKDKPNKDEAILRFYTWEPSYTVGISQNPTDYNEYGSNHAKRVTGGGVLFHGHDLSYSLVLPTSKFKALGVKETYELICSFLLKFYKNLGLKAAYVKDIPELELSKSSFCQVGFESYDIIINGVKIGGNAQRRTKDVIFQHGSIPLYEPHVASNAGSSLEQIGLTITYQEAMSQLKEAFETTFNLELSVGTLTQSEEMIKQRLIKELHDSKE